MYSQIRGGNRTLRNIFSYLVEIDLKVCTSGKMGTESATPNEAENVISSKIHTLMPGGLKGYSEGNNRIPWNSPPAKGESGGPR
jgi:hypothetical protein